uniref:Uncharacterized protein n=1 Tax=Rhizophora mucronata TaxID=61149 RepID=A0A2P2P4X8_RHIMU
MGKMLATPPNGLGHSVHMIIKLATLAPKKERRRMI